MGAAAPGGKGERAQPEEARGLGKAAQAGLEKAARRRVVGHDRGQITRRRRCAVEETRRRKPGPQQRWSPAPGGRGVLTDEG